MAQRPPKDEALDAKVLQRRQKDLDGFLAKYDDIIKEREAKYAKEIGPFWQRAGRKITDEIRAVYNEVQDAQGVPIEGKPISKAKLRNMKRQISRLQRLQQQLIEMLGTDQQRQKLDRDVAYSYSHAYYYQAFGLEQAAKVAINVPTLTASQVMGVIANPWLPDGANYSHRIRANTEFLAKKMVKATENAIQAGWSINRTARHISDIAGEGYYNAVRLARTEINRAASQGASHTYMQNADIMDGKRWNATLDSKTAPKDAQNDGEIYDLDYDTPENPGKPGERIPNHPNCRCKWTPVLSALGVSTKERIARDENGGRTYTKARSYREYAEERGLPNVDDAVRNDNPRSYLRRGETIYDIPSDFFSPTRAVVFAGTATAIKEAVVTTPAAAAGFQPAKTVKEANAWAAGNIAVKQIDFQGFDIRMANEISEELYNLTKIYPEVDGINFVGTSQKRNTLLYEAQVKEFKEKNKEILSRYPQAQVDKFVKQYVKKRKVPGNTYAQAANHTWGELAGIAFNQKWAKDYDGFKRSVANDVKSRWHPEGTEAPVSVFIHEFGHSIDYFLDRVGLRDKYLTPITKEFLDQYSVEMEEGLSRYAMKNDREVIAEAFAEYRLNPNPRKWARKVGEAIEAALDEYRKGL